MTYAHSTANQIQHSKLDDKMTEYLSRIPAEFPSDIMALKVMFNAVAELPRQYEQTPFFDEQSNPVAGVHVEIPMGHHYLANCSLDGLAKLSHDPRVLNVSLLKLI